MSENTKRIISAVWLTAIIAAAGITGSYILLIMCAALSVLAEKEFFNALSLNDSLLRYASYAMCIIYYIAVFICGHEAAAFFAVLSFTIYMIITVFTFPDRSIKESFLYFAGLIYTCCLMSFLYLCREKGGIALYALVFICSWLGDTFAYSVGRRIGKHKMVPRLSPHKSVEGFIAGLAGCTVTGALFGVLFKKSFSTIEAPVLACALSGFFGQLLSVAGDLTASAIKRECGIKDYSNLIPGHGGVLDRFDSVLFAAPFVYSIFTIMEKIFL